VTINEIRKDGLGRVRLGEVLRLTGWCRTTLWRNTKTGQFPRPAWGKKRGESWYWRASDIEQWAQAREQATDQPPSPLPLKTRGDIHISLCLCLIRKIRIDSFYRSGILSACSGFDDADQGIKTRRHA